MSKYSTSQISFKFFKPFDPSTKIPINKSSLASISLFLRLSSEYL